MPNLETAASIIPDHFNHCFERTPWLDHGFRRRLTYRECVALRLRNEALQVLRVMGIVQVADGIGPHLLCDDGNISIRLSASDHQFPPHPVHPAIAMFHEFLGLQPRSYRIDVWQENEGKVFSIVWSTDGAFEVITCKRNAWQERIRARAALITLAANRRTNH